MFWRIGIDLSCGSVGNVGLPFVGARLFQGNRATQKFGTGHTCFFGFGYLLIGASGQKYQGSKYAFFYLR